MAQLSCRRLHFDPLEYADMPKTYEKFGVKFLYPDNWDISDEQVSYAPYEVSIQCPDGGFWMLRVYSQVQSPNLLLDEVRQSMRAEYKEVDCEPFTDCIEATEIQGCEMNFYYLDFVVTAKSECFSLRGRTFLVHAQAESRDFDQSEPVFRAILLSLIRSELVADA